MARNDKQMPGSDTINELALRRAFIGSAPLPAVARGGVLVEVEIDKIEPNPDQPRQWIDPDGIQELAASIASRGTCQPDNPILVRPAPDGEKFLLISGERRWRAKQLLREQAPADGGGEVVPSDHVVATATEGARETATAHASEG